MHHLVDFLRCFYFFNANLYHLNFSLHLFCCCVHRFLYRLFSFSLVSRKGFLFCFLVSSIVHLSSGSLLFHHIFVNCINFMNYLHFRLLLLLILSFIPFWSDKINGMIAIFFNLLRLALSST